MCYSPSVSIGTFAFVALAAAILWHRAAPYDRPIALILLVVVSMQLLEWGLWLTGPSCTSALNKALTALIPIVLYAQPVLLNAIVWKFNAGLAPPTLYEALTKGLLLLFPLFVWKLAPLLQSKSTSLCTTADPVSGHLAWPVVLPEPWSSLYYPAMLTPLLSFRDSSFGLLYTFFAALSWTRLRSSKEKTWPSVWCHFVNFLAVFALVRPVAR